MLSPINSAQPDLSKAIAFAKAAHGDQLRNYTGEPYINHPLTVATITSLAEGCDKEMLEASILHDVLEDTEVTTDGLIERFGVRVTMLVVELTDVSTYADGNRATRKALDRERLGAVSPKAQTIKLADLIHNTESITDHDPKFAKIYMAEKRELLKVLTKGDKMLHRVASAMVADYYGTH